MTSLRLWLACLLFAFAGVSSAALTTLPSQSVHIDSSGSWSSNGLGSATQFTLDTGGKYELTFSLTPDAGSSALASLQFALMSPDGLAGSFSTPNVGSNSFSHTLTLDLKPGQYSYYLAFTNYPSWKGTFEWNLKPVPQVPEPETWAMLGLGLAGVLASRMRRRKAC